jgi:hypothetical protein
MACYGLLQLDTACYGLLWLAMACYGLLWLAMSCYGLLCFAINLLWLDMACLLWLVVSPYLHLYGVSMRSPTINTPSPHDDPVARELGDTGKIFHFEVDELSKGTRRLG